MPDTGLRSPLLDFFRRGEVARDIRLLAAQGAFAPRAIEQLAILVLLLDDPDPVIAGAAEATLERLPREALASFLARPDVTPALRAFFEGRGVQAGTPPPQDQSHDEPLVEAEPGAPATAEPDAAEPEQQDDRKPAAQHLLAMGVTGKLKAALKGSREERALLIRDPNRMVAAAVLSSPRLGDDEVEGFARQPTVSEDVLRAIAANRAWMRNYGVVQGLTRNPKTPLALSLNLLARLNDRDLQAVSLDRNIPEPLRIAARKKVVAAQSGRR